MDVIRFILVLCSIKLEFYYERLSVSQKARIKRYFNLIIMKVRVIKDEWVLVGILPFLVLEPRPPPPLFCVLWRPRNARSAS
jgi:hypothetical protein